ncbi:MAG: TorF family putative porin [Acidiferrobacterales bacterium]|nr:TorF family putative porin [Acidiferrobacterales bacterium]
MKNLKFLSGSLAAVMLATSAMLPTVAQAEVSASLAISNFYLWRGLDLSNNGEGNSAPAVSGDISISGGGFYGGVWASSGDEALGQEYDLFAGWGGEFGDFSVDVSYWTYVYPSSDIDPGDAEDLVIGLGFAGFGFTLYESLSDDAEEYRYITADYSFGDFNVLVGIHDFEFLDDNPTHLQLGYAYNDNLSFTVTKMIEDADGFVDDDVLFNVGYSFSF